MKLLCVACLAQILFLFSSCKKNETLPDRLDASSAVNSWQQDFSNLKAIQKKEAEDIVAHLNYSLACKIKNFQNESVLLIKIDKNYSSNVQKYLAFTFEDDSYTLAGIYQASSLEGLQTFLTTKSLVKGESILLSNIGGRIITGWIKNNAGNLIKFAPASKRGSGSPVANNVSLNQYRTNNMQDPDEEDCIYHYMVYTNDATGEIVWIEYLYKECLEGSGGGNGGGDEPPPPVCSDAISNLNTSFDTIEEAGDHGSIKQVYYTSDSAEFKYEWVALQASSMGFNVYVKSFETGTHENHSVVGWHWRRIKHDNIGTEIPILVGVTFEAKYVESSAIGTFSSFGGYDASMSIKIDAGFSMVCRGFPIQRTKIVPCSTTWNVAER